MISPGIRVIRGFDWVWGDQDGGAGGVGTVLEVGKPGSKGSPDKTVVVNWDCGIRSNYRVGYQGCYDLILLDNAQCGVIHKNHVCDCCHQNGIVGIRYKCSLCNNLNLCSFCYHNDKHNLDHPFLRYTTAASSGVLLTSRSQESKLCVKGIFPKAIVQRGHDWKWDNQDGGDGKTGTVTEICNWGSESQRSVACVTWHTGYKNDYRVGHKGIMDLKYVTAAAGGHYYAQHLPELGRAEPAPPPHQPQQGQQGQQAPAEHEAARLAPGDRVRVLLDVAALKGLQQGHGGWNPRMQEYIGKVGVVHRITDRGDVRVQYEGCPNRWTFHPGALVREGRGAQPAPGPSSVGGAPLPAGELRCGDEVLLVPPRHAPTASDAAHSQQHQAIDAMAGERGVVVALLGEGLARVQLRRAPPAPAPAPATAAPGPAPAAPAPAPAAPGPPPVWTLPRHCLARPSPDTDRQLLGPGGQGAGEEVCSAEGAEGGAGADSPELKVLMSKVAQGNLEYVRDARRTCPHLLDAVYCGKTALQVAAYQGHLAVARELLAAGARPHLPDPDGDTALHDATFGNQPEILELLLQHPQVEIDSANRSRCTALHIAAHKCLPHCVTVILRHRPDVNAQDTYGDTALHDAINCRDPAAAATATTTTTTTTMAGQDVRQVRRGHDGPDGPDAEELSRSPTSPSRRIIQMLVDQPGIDFTICNNRGFNTLQHAALKGNAFACEAICRRAPHLVDVPKDDGFSPLHLAALNGHRQAVRALVQVGSANLNLRNKRQQTPLLLAISQGHGGVVEALVALGAQVGARDEDGNTALHIVALKKLNMQAESARPTPQECPTIHRLWEQLGGEPGAGCHRLATAMALYLVRAGCPADAANCDGSTPLDLLAQDQDMLRILLRRMATLEEDLAPTPEEGAGSSSARAGPEQEQGSGQAAGQGQGQGQRPNSTRELAFSGPADDANMRPHRNHNLDYNTGSGEWSGADSPLHRPRVAPASGAGAGADADAAVGPGGAAGAGAGAAPALPARPSRARTRPSASSTASASATAAPGSKPAECGVCSELSDENCVFEPCGHRLACEDCAARMKKCLQCGILIEKRLTVDGRVLVCKGRQPSAERLRYLECKLQELEETQGCPICMERRRTVAFLCGHGACTACARTLHTCHMCRQPVTHKIHLY